MFHIFASSFTFWDSQNCLNGSQELQCSRQKAKKTRWLSQFFWLPSTSGFSSHYFDESFDVDRANSCARDNFESSLSAETRFRWIWWRKEFTENPPTKRNSHFFGNHHHCHPCKFQAFGEFLDHFCDSDGPGLPPSDKGGIAAWDKLLSWGSIILLDQIKWCQMQDQNSSTEYLRCIS